MSARRPAGAALSAAEDEARRQAQVLALIAGRTDDAGAARLAAPAVHGLRAYRANAHAAAARALRAACPCVVAMIGNAGFDAMAAAFWRAHPPQHGDWAEWGDALPAWLSAQSSLADWPWLVDAARLDLALHHCERAADFALDAGSLQALATTDPARLRLRLAPGTVLIESDWPLLLLYRAHAGGPDADEAFESAREAMASRRGAAVLVARQGLRPVVHVVTDAELPWLRALVAGRDLGHALDAAGPVFDFADWLARALERSLLQGLQVMDD